MLNETDDQKYEISPSDLNQSIVRVVFVSGVVAWSFFHSNAGTVNEALEFDYFILSISYWCFSVAFFGWTYLVIQEIVCDLILANRTKARTEALVQNLGGRAIPFEEIASALEDVDIVIAATDSPQYIIGQDMVSAALAGRHDRPQPLEAVFRVTGLYDQHTCLAMPADSPLGVGDLVSFGISHPCTTFDKWQLLYVVDDHHDVIEAIRTFF